MVFLRSSCKLSFKNFNIWPVVNDNFVAANQCVVNGPERNALAWGHRKFTYSTATIVLHRDHDWSRISATAPWCLDGYTGQGAVSRQGCWVPHWVCCHEWFVWKQKYFYSIFIFLTEVFYFTHWVDLKSLSVKMLYVFNMLFPCFSFFHVLKCFNAQACVLSCQ